MSTIDLDAIKREILRASGMGVRKPVLSIEQAESLVREVERLRGERDSLLPAVVEYRDAMRSARRGIRLAVESAQAEGIYHYKGTDVKREFVNHLRGARVELANALYLDEDVAAALARVPPPAGQGEEGTTREESK